MQKIRVSIADDNIFFRETLAMLFNEPGSDFKLVIEAENGKDLLEQLAALSGSEKFPELCLLDFKMPEMNGLETMKRLDQLYPDLHVLALSLYDTDFNVLTMIRHGARGFLTKNSPIRRLLHASKTVAKGDYYIPPEASRMLVLKGKSQVPGLTEKEIEFLTYCHKELTYKEIGEKMFLSERTIHTYRDNLFEKLNIKSRTGLVAYAFKIGLVDA